MKNVLTTTANVARKGAEKSLMGNVLLCTAAINMITKVQELSFNKATECRSQRLHIHPEQAAKELTVQHEAICNKAQSIIDTTSDRASALKAKLSFKKATVQVA